MYKRQSLGTDHPAATQEAVHLATEAGGPGQGLGRPLALLDPQLLRAAEQLPRRLQVCAAPRGVRLRRPGGGLQLGEPRLRGARHRLQLPCPSARRGQLCGDVYKRQV